MAEMAFVNVVGQNFDVYIVLTIVILVVTALMYISTQRRRIVPGRGLVLYQIGRGPAAPSISPFPLKLETYLRMAKIPYQNDHTGIFSSKGKTPWISHNGKAVADSQFSIDYLNSVYDIDLNRHLTAEQRAISRAFQKMTEENLYWTMCASTFGDDLSSLYKVMPYRGVKLWVTARVLRYLVRRQMAGHGIGRHSHDDVMAIGAADLRALSGYMGKKKFLMGDCPCEADCAIFGMLAQIYWHMPDSQHHSLIKDELYNLIEYCERMKTCFWPDWDECVTCWGAKLATK